MTVFIPETAPLQEADIRRAEFRLKCSLPFPFRRFVARHDGAEPQDNVFKTSDNASGVRNFVPISEAAALREQIEGFPKKAIPIAEDGCGNYVWLHQKTGQVFFWHHELESDGEKLAEDFDAFLQLLKTFDPGSVPKPEVKSVWIDPEFAAQQASLFKTDDPD